MERDLLTRQECDAFLCDRSMTIDQTLQAAARLGAERERERAVAACEVIVAGYEKELEAMDPIDVDDGELDRLNAAAYAAEECAEAIRRGEGEQA